MEVVFKADCASYTPCLLVPVKNKGSVKSGDLLCLYNNQAVPAKEMYAETEEESRKFVAYYFLGVAIDVFEEEGQDDLVYVATSTTECFDTPSSKNDWHIGDKVGIYTERNGIIPSSQKVDLVFSKYEAIGVVVNKNTDRCEIFISSAIMDFRKM